MFDFQYDPVGNTATLQSDEVVYVVAFKPKAQAVVSGAGIKGAARID